MEYVSFHQVFSANVIYNCTKAAAYARLNFWGKTESRKMVICLWIDGVQMFQGLCRIWICQTEKNKLHVYDKKLKVCLKLFKQLMRKFKTHKLHKSEASKVSKYCYSTATVCCILNQAQT